MQIADCITVYTKAKFWHSAAYHRTHYLGQGSRVVLLTWLGGICSSQFSCLLLHTWYLSLTMRQWRNSPRKWRIFLSGVRFDLFRGTFVCCWVNFKSRNLVGVKEMINIMHAPAITWGAHTGPALPPKINTRGILVILVMLQILLEKNWKQWSVCFRCISDMGLHSQKEKK